MRSCRFSTHLAIGSPVTWASSSFLSDLTSDPSHRSGQFLRVCSQLMCMCVPKGNAGAAANDNPTDCPERDCSRVGGDLAWAIMASSKRAEVGVGVKSSQGIAAPQALSSTSSR